MDNRERYRNNLLVFPRRPWRYPLHRNRVEQRSPSSKIVRSADGITWQEAGDTDISGYLEDVAYGADRFVAVGESGKIIRSPDGDRWTDATTATATDLDGVAGAAAASSRLGETARL